MTAPTDQSQPYLHYALPISLYSGKTRAYLRYKAIPHREKPVRLWTLGQIRRRTGETVMPVVRSPAGEWLQDTSAIIDTLEARFPLAPIVPQTPRQKIAAYLLEAWGDEFWLASAMHYRWNFAENFRDCFEPEMGAALLPLAPRLVRDRLARAIARPLRGFLPGLGVIPEQIAQIERWTQTQLDHLETHFGAHPYLLGSKPSLGDFGLIGPLYAHLGRDPWPARELMGPRPHLRAWIERMQNPPTPQQGVFAAADAIPETLAPLWASIFGEFWPQLEATAALLPTAEAKLQNHRSYPRQIGRIEIPLAGSPFRMRARSYSLWMAQRPLDAYHALAAVQQARVRDWLQSIGGESMLALSIQPRLVRQGLRVAPA